MQIPSTAQLPTRPRMPTDADEWRSQHQAARWKILNEDWEDIEQDWLENHVGKERVALWGPPDLSANPLAEISRQLATPGLYGSAPEVRHQDEAAQRLVGPGGYLSAAGYWTRMQRVQYLAHGLGDVYHAHDVSDDGRLVLRLVRPQDVYVEVDADETDRAVALWELRLRWWDARAKWVYTWDRYDLGEWRGAVEVRPPSYSVALATQDGKAGEDVSNVFLVRPDGTSGGLFGDAYPFRVADGTPILRHIHYRTLNSGDYWNHLDRRGVHRGTLNTALYYTYAGHCARDATGRMVFCVGVEAPADVQRDEGNYGQPLRTMQMTPGAAYFTEPTGQGQPLIVEVGPGANLPDVSAWAQAYELKQATRWGLNPADITRQHANPTSGAALAISTSQKREVMGQVEEIFRAADLEAIRVSAALLRLAGVDAGLPEDGYSITYAPIRHTPQEDRDERDAIDWEVSKGYLSPLDAYRRLHPGATAEDALAAIVQAREDQARIDEELEIRGIVQDEQESIEQPGEVALAEGVPEAESVADTALNGAQVEAAKGIVEAVAAGSLPRDTGVEMLVAFFRLDRTLAEQVMGSVGTAAWKPMVASAPKPEPEPENEPMPEAMTPPEETE